MSAPSGSAKGSGRHAVAFIFTTVLIDAIGIGLIIPVMPALIQDLTGEGVGAAAIWGGLLSFVYALMQFACGPALGSLSDRFGRRPVLLGSLVMLCVDYLIMGFAPTLALLFVGRVLSGIAGATHSTANAFIADVSAPEMRAQNFGLVGAAFGVGFIVGPAIGGLLGEFGTRAPFFAAAGLALANAIYGAVVLPESLSTDNRRPFAMARANPFGAFAHMARIPMVGWFLCALLLFQLAHWVYPATWSYYTQEAFGWSSAEIGLSLAAVGVGFAVVQGGLIRIIIPRYGAAATSVFGLAISAVAMAAIALATEGWMIYALMPLTALGNLATPAMTGVMSNAVPADAQGQLQGVIASIGGLTAVVSPLMMTQLFGYFVDEAAPVHFPGAPYMAGAIFIALALATLLAGLRRIPAAAGET